MTKNLQTQFLLLTFSFCFFSIAPLMQGAQLSFNDQKSKATSNPVVVEEKQSMNANQEKKWWEAIQNGDAKEVKNFLQKYTVNIDKPSIYEMTALHCAAANNNVEVAKLLIEARANVDLQNNNGMTALHVAALYNNVEVAKLLIDTKARTFVA